MLTICIEVYQLGCVQKVAFHSSLPHSPTNTHYYHIPLLPSITKWSDHDAETTIHFACKISMNPSQACRKLSSWWVTFMVLEGTTQTARGEKASIVFPSTESTSARQEICGHGGRVARWRGENQPLLAGYTTVPLEEFHVWSCKPCQHSRVERPYP